MNRKKVAGLVAGGVLVAAPLAMVGTPAEAATTMRVCNSPDSFTRIVAKNDAAAISLPNSRSNNCFYLGNNSSTGYVRVDTDPDGPSHSYKIWSSTTGWGGCHANSDNHSSDPPNVDAVTYRNFDHGDCTN